MPLISETIKFISNEPKFKVSGETPERERERERERDRDIHILPSVTPHWPFSTISNMSSY